MCPGADSDSKSEYQDIPGGKGGRCVKLTTYHLQVPSVKKSGGLNLLEHRGPVQACNGTALPLSKSKGLPQKAEVAQGVPGSLRPRIS